MTTNPDEKAARGPKLKWLHRVGYVTTVIVAIQLALVAFILVRDFVGEMEFQRGLTERTRTREGALQRDPKTPEFMMFDEDIRMLSDLPALDTMHGNGVKFAALPSFGTADYALAVWMADGAAEAAGALLVVTKDVQPSRYTRTPHQRAFRVPRDDFEGFAQAFDKLTIGWPGDTVMCLDGEGISFERVRGKRITSGAGNICSPHYEKVAALVLEMMRKHAPGDDLPTGSGWHKE